MSTSGPQSAYVHVPFCLHKCGYCDFTVVAGRDDLTGPYLDCLELELHRRLGAPQPMQTIFIGGGTPTYLLPDDLDRLLALVQKWLPLQSNGEYSIECNPEGFTTDRMDVLKARGVNRISLGVQSVQQEHLRTLERSHTFDTVITVVRQLRERGFENVSLDLIFGVPGQSLKAWEETLTAAVSLAPQHVSTYGLTYEKGTAFWARRARQTLLPAPEELERDMYALAMTFLPAHGYRQYELSNFARAGAACRHNQVYWQGAPYYGFGPGAAGFVRGIRSLNHRSVTTWIKRIQQGASPVQEEEQLSLEMRAREAVMLGLRQIDGIDHAQFQSRFGTTLQQLEPEAFLRFQRLGWLEETLTHVRLTPEGRFVADSVMSEFL